MTRRLFREHGEAPGKQSRDESNLRCLSAGRVAGGFRLQAQRQLLSSKPDFDVFSKAFEDKPIVQAAASSRRRNVSFQAARLILPRVECLSWLARRMLSAKRRNRARFSGPWSLRARDWSSSMTTENSEQSGAGRRHRLGQDALGGRHRPCLHSQPHPRARALGEPDRCARPLLQYR
jgi:hypothetical protein